MRPSRILRPVAGRPRRFERRELSCERSRVFLLGGHRFGERNLAAATEVELFLAKQRGGAGQRGSDVGERTAGEISLGSRAHDLCPLCALDDRDVSGILYATYQTRKLW